MQSLILILKLKCVFPGIEPERNEASRTFCLAQVSKCASKNQIFGTVRPQTSKRMADFFFFHELSDAIPASMYVKQPIHVHHVSIPRIINTLSFFDYTPIVSNVCWYGVCACVQCLGLRNHMMKYVTSYVVKLGNHVRKWWETYQQNILWRSFC